MRYAIKWRDTTPEGKRITGTGPATTNRQALEQLLRMTPNANDYEIVEVPE